MQAKKSIKNLPPYVPGKPIMEVKKEFNLKHVIKMASNENPYGCSEKVKESMKQELNTLHFYPDGGALQLKKELANYHQVSEKQLLIGSGLDDVIQIISRALLEPNDEIVQAHPTFSQYSLHATIEGAKTVSIPVKNDGSMDLDGMLQAITKQTKIIWLCNPNNPTGTYVKQNEIKSFLEKVPENILVISDEAYFDYVSAEKNASSLPLINQFTNLLVMRTFSKAYGLASLRIGYAIAPEPLIHSFDTVRLPFNTSQMAQCAAITALKDREFISQTVRTNKIERDKWKQFLTELHLPFYDTEANFIFFDTKKDTTILTHQLLQKGFIVREGLKEKWLRISIGLPEENLQLQKLLRELL